MKSLLLSFALLLAVSPWAGGAPAQPAIVIPPGAEILSRCARSHPRLLLSSEGFAQLKKRTAKDPQLQAWARQLHKDGQDLLKAPASRYEIPDGLRLLATSRRVMDRVYTLALLYRLEGDKAYLERAWTELSAAAAFPDWNPRHFLDTAEMTHAFAIGYDWLYDAWTPEQREALRQAMVQKGLEPALTVYRKHNWWVSARHNWNQVCNGGIGMGALALADVEPARAGEILHDGLTSIQLAMAEFAPDGAWKEGPGYWNYATLYNVVFLAGLHSALGTDYGLSQMPGFEQTGFFPIYLTGPLGRTFNYADGGDHAIRAAQMFWLAQRFHQPALTGYEQQHAAPGALDLVWYPGSGVSAKEAGLPLDKYFRGAEVATFRSGWEDTKALFAAFKAGDNKANHSHLDLGSFVFDALGARWAVDLGADDYNLPGYFGGQRWNYYRLRAEGQNTLVINPGQGPDQDPKAATRIERFSSQSARSFAIADLTPAYRQSARKVERGLALLERQRLLIQDEIQADKPAEVWWFMHTAAGIRIEDGGRRAVLQQAGLQLEARLLAPQNAQFQILDAAPLPSSPHPEKQAKNEHIKKLTVHLSGATNSQLAVVLEPCGTGEPPPVTLSRLAQW